MFFTQPIDVYAQAGGNVQTLLADSIFVINLLGTIFSTLALLFFLWGLAKFILAAGDESKIAEGKRIMFWGVIALFVMVSVYGITAFIADAFNLQGSLNSSPVFTLPPAS